MFYNLFSGDFKYKNGPASGELRPWARPSDLSISNEIPLPFQKVLDTPPVYILPVNAVP